MCELLKSKDLYTVDEHCTAEAYDADRLRVLKGDLIPKPAVNLVGDDAKCYLLEPDRYIVKGPEEMEEVTAPVDAYWDASLRKDLQARRHFVEKLRRTGLVTWRRRVRASCGAFFVTKKNGMQRMVLDCRPANQLHRRPPHSALAASGGL